MPEGGACRCGRGTLYDVLQVSPWCEPEVIQAAFRALARSRHPDVNRSADADEQMRRLNVAYQTLSDPASRSRYDEELALEAPRPMTARPAPSAGYGHGYGAGAATRPAQATPGAGGTGAGVAGAPASGARPPYQPGLFDARGDLVLPRSTIYVSVVMVVIIIVLLTMLMLDFLADGTGSPARNLRVPAGILTTGSAPSSISAPATAWTLELSGPPAEPGLSQPRAR